MLRLIFTSSETRLPLGKFTFYTSRWVLSSLTSQPRACRLHSSLSLIPVSTSIVATIRTAGVGVLELFVLYHRTWAPGPSPAWGLTRPIRGPSVRRLGLIRVSPQCRRWWSNRGPRRSDRPCDRTTSEWWVCRLGSNRMILDKARIQWTHVQAYNTIY
jgi:hypothetical protein